MNHLLEQLLTILTDHSLWFALMAAACFAVMWMNTRTFHQRSIFKDKPPISFFGLYQDKRKYKYDAMDFPVRAPDNLYYSFYKIKYKEAFPLSATLLSMFTDGFHSFQFMGWNFIALAVHHESFTGWLIVRLAIWIVWGVMFEIILKKR